MLRLVSAFALSVLIAPPALANPEPTATYDARVSGMGGVAIATVDSAAALFHNPARLDQIERFATTVVVQSLLVNLEAPFAGPGTERDSGILYAPLFFVGAAGRVHYRIRLGFGVYIYTGFGGGYEAVDCIGYGEATSCDDDVFRETFMPPQDQNVTLFIAEAAIPVQVTIAEGLSLGVSLRMPWGRQVVDASQESQGLWLKGEQRVSGFGIPGVLFGASYEPTRDLTLAFAYRSKVWVDLDGTTSTEIPFVGEVVLPTKSRWYVPHMFRLGGAYHLWQRRLLIAAEARVQLHREANAEQRFELEGEGVPSTTARFDWNNVYLGALALELYVHPRVPLRLAGSIGSSATNPDTITPFSPPFGVQIAAYGGFGIKFGPIDLDLSFGWGGGPEATVETNAELCVPSEMRPGTVGREQLTAAAGCAGTYDVDSWFLGFSATYRHGRSDSVFTSWAAQSNAAPPR